MTRRTVRIAARLATGAASLAALALAISFVPTLFGYEAMVVGSGSMGRALPVGAVAITRMVDVKAIESGDVVSFRHPGRETTLTHRVIDVAKEQGQRVFTTKGDANAASDPEPLVVASGEIARLERVIPYAGYLVRHARSPAGGLLLFAFPILGLVFDPGRRGPRRTRERARPPRGVFDSLEATGWSSSALALATAREPLPHPALVAPGEETACEALAAPSRVEMHGRLAPVSVFRPDVANRMLPPAEDLGGRAG